MWLKINRITMFYIYTRKDIEENGNVVNIHI